ncbi:MAG: nucleoside-diphosphate sugar epimerase/dehydratase [Mariprofundaceae bacterium]|nr:nucleoside-diphosphate sugar epimerase/dehydratase [Mariprofundaceae bacterium]
MNRLIVLRSRWLVFVHDLLWVPAAIFLAFWLRFNMGEIPADFMQSLRMLIAVALPVQAAVFWYFGLYRGIWRFASIPDLLRILRAVLFGTALTFAAMFVWQRLEDVPRSVLVLYPVILALALATPRMFYRWMKDHHLNLTTDERRRALLIGAGRAGELLVRDLLKSGPYEPVGFLDDAGRRQGQEIHGVRVLGRLGDLEKMVGRLDIEVVLLTMPSASHRVIQSVVEKCQQLNVPCRTLPSVADLADGRVEVSSLRQVQIEDLLGRDVIEMDDTPVRQLISGQCVLVTGAGGSIGSELCRQVMRHDPASLIMVDHGEYNLYRIEGEIRRRFPSGNAVALLGDIRDETRMRWLFEAWQPQVIFNAAAYKHVPLVEENPAEGVKTNILGTCQLADLAVAFQARKFVQISTDKAVNPANIMGATKRAAEIYCQNMNTRAAETAFITTRFGNVLGSAGSVVPLFREQIEHGGPVTVTHPEITRYFMTIPEAVSLILQAGAMGEGGEIFVLDMGEPVRIADLAGQMIRLSGLMPGEDIEIVYTGLRPGEKLYEELFHASESLKKTTHPKIMLSASREADWTHIRELLERLRAACAGREPERLKAILQEMVPEYTSGTGVETPRPGVSAGAGQR